MPSLQELCVEALKHMVHAKDRSNLAAADAKRVRLETKYYDEQFQAHKDARMNPKRVSFWDGNENGSFACGTQISHPITVKEYGGRWTPQKTGVIVVCGTRTRFIEEPRLVNQVPVMMGNYVATQWTGFMKFPHESGEGLAVVRWKNEQYLLNPKQIEPFHPSDNQRKKKSPDRLQPDENGKLKWKPEEVKQPKFTSSEQIANKLFTANFCAVGEDGLFKARDLKVQHMLRCGDIGGAVREALNLMGSQRDAATGNIIEEPTTLASEGQKRQYRSVMNDHNRKQSFEFELLYSIMKCQRLRIPGESLLHESFKALPSSTEAKITPNECASKTSKKCSKRIYWCTEPGCNRKSVPMYHPYCATHKKKVKRCSKCGKGEARCAGGLCRSCNKIRYSDNEDFRLARLCKFCHCRPTKRTGGYCVDCRDVKKPRK